MINKINLINGCKGISARCDCKIMLLDMFGELRAYVFPVIHLKTRDIPYIEVIDAIDITDLAVSYGTNFAKGLTEQSFREVTQFYAKESFKFEHSNYIWFTKVNSDII